ncbi:hypothetical protein EDB83DRAFT_2310869 [Lactarius deliciosus]|nr:hypothetical protein EDB83DRAFT_2310869 [Lactarius deliciosus]
MASNVLSFLATQHFSMFSFGDILGNTDNHNNFTDDFTATGMSDERLDLTSALVSPHIGPGLLPHSQPVVSGQVSGNSQGSDPAYASLAYMYQQCEHQFQQLTHGYNSLRMSHEELTKSHKIVLAYMETSKTPTTCNQESDHKTVEPSTWKLIKPLVRSDYPLIKFWTKLAWKLHSDTVNDLSSLNVDGMPINGIVAGQIQVFACSIWHGLLNRKAAPPKWGDAPMDVREHYYYDMEVKFKILRYCEGHWKAQAVAMLIYSQWHSTFVKKCGVAVKEEGGAEPDAETAQATSTKRPRLASSNDVSESPSLQKNITGSMPKGITPIDPLADVFNNPSATTKTGSPGPTSVMLPAPTTIETQVGSSPTSTSTQDTPVISETSSNPHTTGNTSGPTLSSSTTSPSAATTGKRVEKKYACNKRMIPGGAKRTSVPGTGVFPILKGPKGTLPDIGTLWRQVPSVQTEGGRCEGLSKGSGLQIGENTQLKAQLAHVNKVQLVLR